MTRNLPRGAHTPPYELMFLFLMMKRPAYGYDVAARLAKMSGGHFKVSYGTIYPILRRLERRRLLRSRRDESSGRVYYELTPEGRLGREELSRKLEEHRGEMEERLLGTLAIHEEMFGRRALSSLLRRAEQDMAGRRRS
jgi:DNA-binding PadR family transcriptional regulator